MAFRFRLTPLSVGRGQVFWSEVDRAYAVVVGLSRAVGPPPTPEDRWPWLFVRIIRTSRTAAGRHPISRRTWKRGIPKGWSLVYDQSIIEV